MIRTLPIVLALILTSCISNGNSNQTALILSMDRVVDSTLPNNEMCDSFILNEQEIIKYFLISEEISIADLHGESFILPCQHEGRLKMNGKVFSYEVIAGGTGYLYDERGFVVKSYICKSDECCGQFLDLC